MNQIKIKSKKINSQTEGELVLKEISLLSEEEKACFFYFYVKNNFLFHTYLQNIQIDDLVIQTEDSLKRDINKTFSKETKRCIQGVFNKYIQSNRGTSANYFGAITVLLSINFLKKKYTSIYTEADIYNGDNKLNNNPIDILCHKILYDLFESKFTIGSNISEIQTQIKSLKKIQSAISDLVDSIYLSTLDFKTKKKILDDMDNCLCEEFIINSEDLLRISIIG